MRLCVINVEVGGVYRDRVIDSYIYRERRYIYI